MPPHQRHFQQEPQNAGMQAPQRSATGQPQNIFSRVNSDITALNSSILLLSQKMKYLIRNEKILGRNLIVVNKKLKEVQESRGQGGTVGASTFEREFSSVSSRLDEVMERLVRMESEVENIKQNYAKSEQLSEIKYVINSINPLEFATLKDVQEIVSGKATGKKKT